MIEMLAQVETERGILFATPLTLVLVPSLYMIGGDLGRLFRRRRKQAPVS